MRVFVIDTNVLVAGLITRDRQSPTARVLDAMLDGRLPSLLSPALLAEYQTVLARPKLASLHRLDQSRIDVLLTTVTVSALWREPLRTGDAPDPGDNHLWALLDEESRAALVTGDQRLLDQPHNHAPVITPGQCLSIINTYE
ncbi:putative toxin-antitoxin system toxin component, PIN family [Spiribacter vilamensis]|uniref:Putative PIN family toxin of toxin-antitoxin system n=1 Tax=Spiribacter vilamensis TaxID=531306 RepID=A0A4Q8D0C7_9GAMM|nr:putative toxin-antitoxin system toxin component, PIN family [Spiribacter vilamensis]RZU98712.1 putative PIN family toxin of toxin-antitoxin system [Spiribacter vilamensis]TVO62262.1 putative toxin-antitoxin system toxin component, PIN family [Spiribacter vilamensis]